MLNNCLLFDYVPEIFVQTLCFREYFLVILKQPLSKNYFAKTLVFCCKICYNYEDIIYDLPANAKIQPKQGDLLVSKVRPYRGAVTVISENITDLVVSGAFTVLRSKNDYPVEVLAVIFRSNIYRIGL
ncbi:MAG: hypothetical protein FWF76_08075 [Oscillospiraceae bacterium]|nr:hypothetical protein [Oscillospiraceae bacterium]